MSTLQILPLPTLRIVGASERVADEAEIGDAVRRLKHQIALEPNEPHVLVYDGTSDPEALFVAVGRELADDGSRSAGESLITTVEAAESGAGVTYPPGPVNVADAWLALDAATAELGLRTVGPYRHIVHPDGSATFLAPTRSATS